METPDHTNRHLTKLELTGTEIRIIAANHRRKIRHYEQMKKDHGVGRDIALEIAEVTKRLDYHTERVKFFEAAERVRNTFKQ